MKHPKPGHWTRRRLLQTLPAMLALQCWFCRKLRAVLRPRKLLRSLASSTSASSAGLTQTIFYGDSTHNTYIVEVNGAGCAFFDYDNDGWMDAFILGGRRLEGIPPGASNRLYHNNRDGTFTDVTAKAGLTRSPAGPAAFASATTTTTASKISFSPTTDRTGSIATTATARSPM